MRSKKSQQLLDSLNSSQIITDYQSGISINSIRKQLNVSDTMIKKLLLHNNIKLRTKQEARNLDTYNKQFSNSRIKIKDPAIIQEIITLYNSGLTSTDICRKYNVAEGTIRLLLQRHNINMRGVKDAQKQPKLHAKKRQAYFKKYGVYNPMQRPEIFEKSRKASFKYKNITIFGRDFKNLQGYESYGINYIINTHPTLNVNDINAGERSQIPSIWYTDSNNVSRIHFPDIFVSKLNTFFEVKGKYTFDVNKKQNLLKRQSAILQGYNYIILIFDKNGICLEKI